MRINHAAKLCLVVIFASTLIYFYSNSKAEKEVVYEIVDAEVNSESKEGLNTEDNLENTENKDVTDKTPKTVIDIKSERNLENTTDLKYILQWTSPTNVPFVYMGKGQQGFIDRNCEYQNCFVTSDRNYLGDYTKFDVIAFAGPELRWMHDSLFPTKRSPHQKFVFASIESSDNYPICSPFVDGFFNWTWTYRLDSERRWGYIIIRDTNGTIVGPNKEMNWIKSEDMKPVNEDLKNIFKSKTKAAAWFVSNCRTKRGRESFVDNLRSELKKFDLEVDIYGQCGTHECSRDNETECDKIVERDYFFYLSFENSFSEDYVTEKLLHALQYKAVPVVYGGANYTRFMPDGAYLNARELGPEKLAKKMKELMNDIEKYSEYFKWTNHYTYHRRNEHVETDDYCGFCSILNDESKVKEISIYENFRKWWNPPDACH